MLPRRCLLLVLTGLLYAILRADLRSRKERLEDFVIRQLFDFDFYQTKIGGIRADFLCFCWKDGIGFGPLGWFQRSLLMVPLSVFGDAYLRRSLDKVFVKLDL